MQCSANQTKKTPLIIGGTVVGVLIIALVVVVALVLTKKMKRASKANQRKDTDVNPIYGPRETIYVDEVAFVSFTVVNFHFTFDHFTTR